MSRLSAHELNLGDIVLVEAALYRWKTSTVKYTWTEWNVGFELQSISLLAAAPRAFQLDDSSTFVPRESNVRL